MPHSINSYLVIVILLFNACSPEVKDGQLIFTAPDPGKGFNFPYYLFLPDNADTQNELALIVEPNNSGFVSDQLEEHIGKAKRIASKEFYCGNFAARKLHVPLLVPVFPRMESEWKIYTHAFDRDVAMQKGNDLERIDLQLLAMVKDAKNMLEERGFHIKEKFLMTGFSASGSFVNRFTAIHPEKVLAAAAGGVNGLLIVPLRQLENSALEFPLGVNNFPSLFNKSFNARAFKKLPQFLYMGEFDDNDAIPYDDGYDARERELVFTLLGKEMQPSRWESCKDIYTRENVNAQIKTYSGIGHEHPENVKNEIVNFFTKHISD